MQVLHVVRSTLEVIEEVSVTMGPAHGILKIGSVKWNKPPLGLLKINWDAALQKETKMMSVGIVVRDDSGCFVAALSRIVHYIVDPLTGETVAVWHAA